MSRLAPALMIISHICAPHAATPTLNRSSTNHHERTTNTDTHNPRPTHTHSSHVSRSRVRSAPSVPDVQH